MLNIKKFTPGIAWFFLVLILICLPGDDLPKANNWMSAIYFDKWVHVGLFSILAFLFMKPVAKSTFTNKNKTNWLLKLLVAVSVWGLTTEFIQLFFIAGRSFDIGDWIADTCGTFLAFICCYKLYLKS